jgi:hypothetical protein
MKMTETILKVENLNVKLDDELIICNLVFRSEKGRGFDDFGTEWGREDGVTENFVGNFSFRRKN